MKYIAILEIVEQEGGCDYTVGCEARIIEFESKSKDLALAYLENKVIGIPNEEEFSSGYEGGYHQEEELSNVRLFEVGAELIVPFAQWYAVAQSEQHKRKIQKENEEEFKQWQRLNAKFK